MPTKLTLDRRVGRITWQVEQNQDNSIPPAPMLYDIKEENTIIIKDIFPWRQNKSEVSLKVRA